MFSANEDGQQGDDKNPDEKKDAALVEQVEDILSGVRMLA